MKIIDKIKVFLNYRKGSSSVVNKNEIKQCNDDTIKHLINIKQELSKLSDPSILKLLLEKYPKILRNSLLIEGALDAVLLATPHDEDLDRVVFKTLDSYGVTREELEGAQARIAKIKLLRDEQSVHTQILGALESIGKRARVANNFLESLLKHMNLEPGSKPAFKLKQILYSKLNLEDKISQAKKRLILIAEEERNLQLFKCIHLNITEIRLGWYFILELKKQLSEDKRQEQQAFHSYVAN